MVRGLPGSFAVLVAIAGCNQPGATAAIDASPGALSLHGKRALLSREPVEPTGHVLQDFLRGYTDQELAAANALFAQRPEPAIQAPVPRKVRVRGTVFVDSNRNGQRESDERALPRTTISDGDRVTHTDTVGGFSFVLQLDGEAHHRFVSVTHPTGYVPTTPWFERVRFDEPRTEYEIAFGLAEDPRSRADRFWFLTTSDTQVSNVAQMLPIAKDYAQMTTGPEKPAFLVTAGDLTSQGTHYEWDTYDFIRASAGVPVYDGYGGHDGNGLKPRSTINYETRIGPPYYSWDYGGVHFVQFVTEDHHLLSGARARQQRWLEADLRAIPAGMPVVVISHYPLPADWFDRRKAEGINVICQVSGHFHTVMAGSRNGVPVLSASPAGEPDWGAYGRPYRRVRVSPEGVSSEVRTAGQYQRLEIVAPGPSATLGLQSVVVLAYDSARTITGVRCRIVSPLGDSQDTTLVKHGDWSWYGHFAPEVSGSWMFELEAQDTAGVVWRGRQTVAVTALRMRPPVAGTDFPWILAGDPARRLKRGPNPPLYPLWVRHTGATHVRHASPAVWNGRVYVAIPNPNAGAPGSGVLCLDARTGREIWRAATPMGDIPGAVTVHKGRVFALTGEGWVAAFDGKTGQVEWQMPLNDEARRGRPLGAIYTTPVPTDRGLLVSDRESPPVLLDYVTGELTRLEGAQATDKYGPFITVHNGTMYSAQSNRQLAVPLFSARPLWEREDDLKSSAGVVAGGLFIFTGCCLDGANVAKAVSVASGELQWATSLPNPRLGLSGTLNDANPIPIVWNDLVLANGREFAALDLTTGRLLWKVACGRDGSRFARSQRHVLGGHSSPLVAGDLAFFGHDDTSVRAVNWRGEVIWEYVVGTPVNTSPASSGALLFVHDHAGNLWCFGPALAHGRQN
jgi:outer membrane protein assembly factor BamB